MQPRTYKKPRNMDPCVHHWLLVLLLITLHTLSCMQIRTLQHRLHERELNQKQAAFLSQSLDASMTSRSGKWVDPRDCRKDGSSMVSLSGAAVKGNTSALGLAAAAGGMFAGGVVLPSTSEELPSPPPKAVVRETLEELQEDFIRRLSSAQPHGRWSERTRETGC